MQSLKQEYATLAAEKKTLYTGWRELSEKRKELLVAKGNTGRILDINQNAQTRDDGHKQKRSIFSR